MYSQMRYEEAGSIQYIEVPYNTKIDPTYQPTIPLHGYKVYDGDNLIHDYIPCKNPEGIEGVYDTIGGVFKDKDAVLEEINAFCRRADKISFTYGGVTYEQSLKAEKEETL